MVSNEGGFHSREEWLCDVEVDEGGGGARLVRGGDRFMPFVTVLVEALGMAGGGGEVVDARAEMEGGGVVVEEGTEMPDLDSKLLLRTQNVRFKHDYR